MRSIRLVAIGCTLAIACGTAAYVARAQTPPKRPVVRVVTNTTTTPDKNRLPASVKTPVVPEAKKPADPELLINRESYSYAGSGHRDPFVSLMNTEEIRPLIIDLKRVAVAFDPSGRNSVAVLRDVGTREQYRVKTGQQIGRMRVAAIHEREVVFGIEEFGYSRQESLAMNDSTKVRTQ